MRATKEDRPVSPVFALDVLGARIRAERESRRWSLDTLAERSGVSRSMLYQVERGLKAPTVLTLDRIATGLDTSISRLVEIERDDRVICMPKGEQAVVRGDGADWERRILSPTLPGIEFEFMRTTIGAAVDAGVFNPHTRGSREYVAVESGELELTLDGISYLLSAGDAIYFAGDCLHGFRNRLDFAVTYYLAMDVNPSVGTYRHG
jgi:XRE family transcriptional regulator, regulator of sulfur utilization